MAADDIVKEYHRISRNTLDKVFTLKNKTCKQIYIANVDDLLNIERHDLQRCKERVSQQCKEFGSYTWSKHTMQTHPAKGLSTELMNDFATLRSTVSQAYLKFGEILQTYPDLVKPFESLNQYLFRSLHLCEAPGAFVQALADFLDLDMRTKWLWRANSLSPYHETAALERMIIDDTFVAAHIDHFLFGPDSSGDIMNFTEDYLAYFMGETGKFQLITCDGSFDCTDNPGNQEASVYPLIMQSWRIVTQCIQRGGCAVIKIYTMFSQDMLAFLNQFCPQFEKVYLHKPAASKPGNSEVYLVGINYKEVDIELVDNFLRSSIYEAAKFFTRHQIDFINFNLATFNKLTQSQRAAIEIKKNEVKAQIKSRLEFISKTVLRKKFLHELEYNNHWQRAAWFASRMKVEDYEEYKQKVYEGSISFPSTFTPEWPLNMLNNFIITPETLTSIIRSKYVVLTTRNNRLNVSDALLRVSCSLFADYKLLDLAQDLNLDYYDMCSKKRTPSLRRLRHYFIFRGSEILIDNLFMSRSDWLEMCFYVARRIISPECIFPASRLAVLLPRTLKELSVDSVRIYLTSSLVLSRFAGSVICFMSLFFEEITLDATEMRFSKRRRSSDELAKYIKALVKNVPSTQEIAQFVPLNFFTNPSIYFKLLEFNNRCLHDLFKRGIRRNSVEEME